MINELCWEFPCLAPSDWSAQHKQGENNPVTLTDWKAALDLTVVKQGVLCLVFHPHGWIRNDQMVELIDHAVATHGPRVKFLSFREAAARMNENLLGGRELRDPDTNHSSVRVVDVNADGLMDVVRLDTQETRVWNPQTKMWNTDSFPFAAANRSSLQFVRLSESTTAATTIVNQTLRTARFAEGTWHASDKSNIENVRHFQAIDLEQDGKSELIVVHENAQTPAVYSWRSGKWNKLAFPVPIDPNTLSSARFVDLDQDNDLDLVMNAATGGLSAMRLTRRDGKFVGWTKVGMADVPTAPPIVNDDGTDSGFFLHGQSMFWQNENTNKLPHLVAEVPFRQFLRPAKPTATGPAASLNSLRVREGFRVELVAAEPQTADPVAFDWDDAGRLWVVEMADYPLGIDGRGKPCGRVRILEDTRPDDGRVFYDKSTVFLDGVPFPNGIMTWKNGVLVSAAPDIFFAADTDGDGVADQKDVLYTGFAEGNQQHRANGFSWGLDNWIHVANGDSGGKIRSVKTGRVLDLSGHDLRIRPDTGDMQLVSGRTQFGRNRDDAGNWFGCNNSRPLWHNVLPARYIRRNALFAPPDPKQHVPAIPGNSPVFPLSQTVERFNDFQTANRFTSACSALVYRGGMFGDSFRGNAFVCEPVHNLVSRMVLKPDGASFTGHRANDETDREFLASSDNWFRPVFVRNGPDGALWIADMYRHVIEHPEWIPDDWQQRLDLRAGHDRGRIYRIVPVRPLPAEIQYDSVEDRLASPHGYVRDAAHKSLVQESNKSDVAARLRQRWIAWRKPTTAENTRRLALGRLHVLCVLDGLQDLAVDDVLSGLRDPDATVRRHAIRLAEQFPDDAGIQSALRLLQDDDDIQVRLQLAFTLGEFPHSPEPLAALATAADSDRWLRTAVLTSLNPGNIDAVATSAFATAAKNPEMNVQLARLVATMDRPTALNAVLDFVSRPQNVTTSVPQLQVANALFVTSREHSEAAFRRIRERLLSAESKSLRDSVHAILHAPHDHAADEIEAAGALHVHLQMASAREKFLKSLETDWLTATQPPAIGRAMLDTLVDYGSPAVGVAMLNAWESAPPGLRGRIVDALLSHASWTELLLTKLEDGSIAAIEIGSVFRQRLVGHGQDKIRSRAQLVFAESGFSDRKAIVRAMRDQLPAGQHTAGRAVFEKRCAACHQLGGIGKRIGADLASLKDKSTDALLTAILDPNRAVESKFIGYVAVTKNGRSHTGMIRSESANAITLVNGEGRESTVLRSDIDELATTNKSLMPEGLEKELAPADLANVIAFVQHQTDKPRAFAGNIPQLVTDQAGPCRLTARNCRIYGPSLKFEAHWGNLGFWASPQDRAVWDVRIDKGGTFKVVAHYACDRQTNNHLRLKIGDQSLTAPVTSTGSWDSYGDFPLGNISLKSGRYTITMDSAGSIKGYLFDLKRVEFRPLP